MTPRPIAVPVLCAVCGRRLRGHPCPNGRYAVSRHRVRNGGRCPGFFFFARIIERELVEA